MKKPAATSGFFCFIAAQAPRICQYLAANHSAMKFWLRSAGPFPIESVQ
jgi:hypothetical protein